MKRNVILIGMPGCGKSSCGVLLAKALCKAFVDTDLIIQQTEGAPLQKIINRKGTEYFAALEENVVSSLQAENSVIATGGSVVYSDKAMAHLKEKGIVVYLNVSYETMVGRISNMKTRGILLRDGESMKTMFDSRQPLYEKYADLTIDCNGSNMEETISRLYHTIKM